MAVDHSMKVLVVDDYKTMIRIIRNLLKQLGFANVDEASDGSSALDMMRQNEYGLVIHKRLRRRRISKVAARLPKRLPC
ncbi:MAG TPA: response regulator, partial [Methyloceanibacter sp.]|nr:response regulator [Methyloceanibacter sp.]